MLTFQGRVTSANSLYENAAVGQSSAPKFFWGIFSVICYPSVSQNMNNHLCLFSELLVLAGKQQGKLYY